jgi:hypothetical protein
VMMDGTEIYSVIEGNPLYAGAYYLTGLDLSAYADGGSHEVSFQAAAEGPGATDFNLDDVSITCGTGTALPIVVTQPATSVTATGATLNGTINANNANTTVIFEYGETTAYGSSGAASPGAVAGSSDTPVSATLAGLSPGATYHYRLSGSSVAGSSFGGDMTFTASCSPGQVRIGASTYVTIQSAIDAVAGDTAVIEAKAGDFTEDLTFAGGGRVTLKGGFDCAFVSNPDFTAVTGSLTIAGAGTVIIENIVVR